MVKVTPVANMTIIMEDIRRIVQAMKILSINIVIHSTTLIAAVMSHGDLVWMWV